MIKIEHLALWVNDLEATKNFYIHYFDMVCGEKYTNIQKQFTSYYYESVVLDPEGNFIEITV
jgi:lactoylglutathione lyase